MFVLLLLLLLTVRLSTQNENEYQHLGRPCHVNHCDNEHVCVRRKDIGLQYRCVPKSYFKHHPEKIAEWHLDPSIMNEIVNATNCQSCLAEPLEYICGTDGRVYRSPCYVKYFNCLSGDNVEIACDRECPCNQTNEEDSNWAIPIEEPVFRDPLDDESPNDLKGKFDQCPRSVHRELRNRFFDWFHQIEKLEHKRQYYDSIDNCHPIVSYMFHHFDLTNDSQLNDDELDSIEHLKNEQCTDIFFQRCDHDNDHRLFSSEWCDCFKYALLPCELHNVDLDKAFWNKPLEGVFRPRCTESGYYAARQCNTETPRECWCVDKHGIEVDGTRQDDDHMPQCDDIEDYRIRK